MFGGAGRGPQHQNNETLSASGLQGSNTPIWYSMKGDQLILVKPTQRCAQALLNVQNVAQNQNWPPHQLQTAHNWDLGERNSIKLWVKNCILLVISVVSIIRWPCSLATTTRWCPPSWRPPPPPPPTIFPLDQFRLLQLLPLAMSFQQPIALWTQVVRNEFLI